jgi:hypothetical protein
VVPFRLQASNWADASSAKVADRQYLPMENPGTTANPTFSI